MKLKIIACDVLYREVCYAAATTPHTAEAVFIPFGLHNTPNLLRERLQEEIDKASAEDFDVVGAGKATAVQVKHTAANITLRSPAVVEAITHYWDLRRRNPDRRVLFRLLTRSGVGVEKGNPFGPDVAGLNLWREHGTAFQIFPPAPRV